MKNKEQQQLNFMANIQSLVKSMYLTKLNIEQSINSEEVYFIEITIDNCININITLMKYVYIEIDTIELRVPYNVVDDAKKIKEMITKVLTIYLMN